MFCTFCSCSIGDKIIPVLIKCLCFPASAVFRYTVYIRYQSSENIIRQKLLPCSGIIILFKTATSLLFYPPVDTTYIRLVTGSVQCRLNASYAHAGYLLGASEHANPCVLSPTCYLMFKHGLCTTGADSGGRGTRRAPPPPPPPP